MDHSSSVGCNMNNFDKVAGMTVNLEQILKTVELLLHYQSPAHDFQHILRVYRNAEMISKKEQGVDLDIVLAAACFHKFFRRYLTSKLQDGEAPGT